jgi:hypothetical protein
MQLSFERTLEEAVQATRFALAKEPIGWTQRVVLVMLTTLGALFTEEWAGPRGADTGLPTVALLALGACAGIAFAMLIVSKRRNFDRYFPFLIEELGPWPRSETWVFSETGLSLELYESSHFTPWSHLRAVRETKDGLLLDWKTNAQSYLPSRLITAGLLATIPMPVTTD